MKLNEIVCKIIILMFLIIICASNICIAAPEINYDPDLSGGQPQQNPTTQGDIEIDYSSHRPVLGSGATGLISKILGALIVVGIIAIVISIALIGFSTILGSASEKALAQEKFGGIFIAAILLTGIFGIAKLLISVAEQIV